ncbi:SWIM zinc finger family protein [Metallosphaera javensis (ex Sakai et al. 2022)]|uniref:SWIM zinc finger family protein n=1 Tax=Metallosphaera javensis (ex Sakai et al. 2022) TaxID=2775498 RepID=UPI0025885598|nr:MAG: hypothetical protein MjAS7_2098 [Metallosphaera javensis (ex Sakai et al. 2022)]
MPLYDSSWYTDAWVRLGLRRAKRERKERGIDYYKEGRVNVVSIAEGEIRATVRGSSRYLVTIRALPFPPGANRIILEKLNVILNLNTFPEEVELELRLKGLSLLPEKIDYDCTCPDNARPCKHVVATILETAKIFARDVRKYLVFRGFKSENNFDVKEYLGDREEMENHFSSLVKTMTFMYSPVEDEELVRILRKMSKVGDTLLKKLKQNL